METGSKTIELKNRDKVFFPEHELTKGDLIDYYEKIADRMLPYLKDRPLTIKRHPNGIKGKGFYQKEKPDYFPGWIDTIEVEKKEGGIITQINCNSKAAVIFLVNEGTLSFHPWLSRSSDLNKPDKLIFDLDPPDNGFKSVIEGAKALHSLLDKIGLHSFVMTTGSEGLHVTCPLKPEKNFDDVRSFAEAVARFLASEYPDSFTVAVRKNKRKDRLFIDYLRNAYAQTSILPYSVRAREGAPVATPLGWDEINKSGLTSKSYHIKNIFRRLSRKKDPWEQFHNKAQSIEESMNKFRELSNG